MDSQRLTGPPYNLASGPTGSQLSVYRLPAAQQMPQAQAPMGSQPPLPGTCTRPVEDGPPLRVATPVPGHPWCLHRVGKRRVPESPPWCHVPAASTALSYPTPRCRRARSPQGSHACPCCCRECWGGTVLSGCLYREPGQQQMEKLEASNPSESWGCKQPACVLSH